MIIILSRATIAYKAKKTCYSRSKLVFCKYREYYRCN